MGETANYGLYVTEGKDDPTFLDWRTNMCGSQNSNMTKIDAALSEKAQKSHFINATLTAAGWTGDTAPYTQVLCVDGMGAEANGSIGLSDSATDAQRAVMRDALLGISAQAAEQLTIVADGERPEVDLPVTVIILD